MSKDGWQYIAAAVVALLQVYGTRADMSMIFARFWDSWAIILGVLANMLARWSLIARSNYFTAVTYGT